MKKDRSYEVNDNESRIDQCHRNKHLERILDSCESYNSGIRFQKDKNRCTDRNQNNSILKEDTITYLSVMKFIFNEIGYPQGYDRYKGVDKKNSPLR